MTRSRSGTRSRPKHRRHPPAARRYRQTANCRCAMKVTFCVRGVLSPLLANIYMRRFVLGWKKLGLETSLGTRLVTYADDLVILCRRGNAEAALHRRREIMGKLKLTVNEDKTQICKSRKASSTSWASRSDECTLQRRARPAWLCAPQRRVSSA